MLHKSFKSFSRSPYYLGFCHIALLKKFNTSHLYGNDDSMLYQDILEMSIAISIACLLDILKMSYRDKTIDDVGVLYKMS